MEKILIVGQVYSNTPFFLPGRTIFLKFTGYSDNDNILNFVDCFDTNKNLGYPYKEWHGEIIFSPQSESTFTLVEDVADFTINTTSKEYEELISMEKNLSEMLDNLVEELIKMQTELTKIQMIAKTYEISLN